VRNATREARPVVAQDRDECVVRIALMEEHGFVHFDRKLELRAKDAFLVRVRREIPEEVEPALACSADFVRTHQVAKFRDVRRMELTGMVRMDAGCRPEPLGVTTHEFDGSTRARERAAGNDHVADARLDGSVDDVIPVVVEAVVREVESDVD
jgi:hypothetical protein